MSVLSRLPERSMLGFSRLVASEVTQPLWPSSVPRITNCSAMLGRWRTRSEDGSGRLSFQGPSKTGALLVRWCRFDFRCRCRFSGGLFARKKVRRVICGPKFKRGFPTSPFWIDIAFQSYLFVKYQFSCRARFNWVLLAYISLERSLLYFRKDQMGYQ